MSVMKMMASEGRWSFHKFFSRILGYDKRAIVLWRFLIYIRIYKIHTTWRIIHNLYENLYNNSYHNWNEFIPELIQFILEFIKDLYKL
jgi:hypothetical protein